MYDTTQCDTISFTFIYAPFPVMSAAKSVNNLRYGKVFENIRKTLRLLIHCGEVYSITFARGWRCRLAQTVLFYYTRPSCAARRSGVRLRRGPAACLAEFIDRRRRVNLNSSCAQLAAPTPAPPRRTSCLCSPDRSQGTRSTRRVHGHKYRIASNIYSVYLHLYYGAVCLLNELG